MTSFAAKIRLWLNLPYHDLAGPDRAGHVPKSRMKAFRREAPLLAAITPATLLLAVFFVVEDTVHYWSHRWLHTPKLYKFVPSFCSLLSSCSKSLTSFVTPARNRWIHKVHHEYPAPFGLTAEYAHPLEVMILGSGTVGGPIIYCALTRNLHLLTMLIWITLRVASLSSFSSS